jgi:hypothetical protein
VASRGGQAAAGLAGILAALSRHGSDWSPISYVNARDRPRLDLVIPEDWCGCGRVRALLGFIWIIAAFAIYGLVTGNPTFLDVGTERAIAGDTASLHMDRGGSILCIGVMIVCATCAACLKPGRGDPFVPENATRFTAIARSGGNGTSACSSRHRQYCLAFSPRVIALSGFPT